MGRAARTGGARSSERQNSTVGTVRAASSASKYSRFSNFSTLGEEHRRELLELVVVVEHAVVVELPGVGDPALGGGQLLLQGEEVLVGLEVGVGLAEGEDLAQRAGQLRCRPAAWACGVSGAAMAALRALMTASRVSRSWAA